MVAIKTFREQKGITQGALADLLGMSRASVAMWETSGAYPRAELLPVLAKLFNCTVDDLFRAEQEQTG